MTDWWLEHGWWIAAMSVAMSGCGIILALIVVVLLPADYFLQKKRPTLLKPRRHPALRFLGAAFKNGLGVVLLAVGLLMAIPLVPGPGILFMALGLSLVNFPGKYAVERYLISKPGLLNPINRIRARWNQPPMVVKTKSPADLGIE